MWFDNTEGNIGGPGIAVVTHQFTGFPAFVDPEIGDYHLTVASAAINRGVNAGVSSDLDGKPRGPEPDLGAYESHPWKFYVPIVMRKAP